MGRMGEWGAGAECGGVKPWWQVQEGVAAGAWLRGFERGVQPQNWGQGSWLTLRPGEEGAVLSPSFAVSQGAVPSWVDDY